MEQDVIIIGAGAAGMMCAIEAGKRGKRVLLLDHSDTVGEKIRISGGGYCNFTNLYIKPENYISANPHFCKSALSRFTQQDFIKLIERHGIDYHEKTLGQLFCNRSAQDIIAMLAKEMDSVFVRVLLNCSIEKIERAESSLFMLHTSRGMFSAPSLVIATGGLSIPKIGATGFAYEVAQQFGHTLTPLRAGLVPLVFDEALLKLTRPLSGISVDPVVVSCNKTQFKEALLLTHRGLSGPAVLQISSYWEMGDEISINLLPHTDMLDILKQRRKETPRKMIHTVLAECLPKRLGEMIAEQSGLTGTLADLSDVKLKKIADSVNHWQVHPTGTEGYRTAEVTVGGVNVKEISSKTFESNVTSGLYFIGECLDVTGHLGGFNFQWAWSSGWCAGQSV